MASGSVKLSIYSTFDDAGAKKAERAINSFVKAYGEVDKATGKSSVSGSTRALLEQSVQLDQAAAKWRGYSESLAAAGEALTKYVSAPAGAAAAAATKLASDYEDSFSKVKTIMDKSAEAPEALSAEILQLSTDTGKAATELAEATYQALSAGVATEKAADFMETAVNLAKAGFTDTTSSVDALTTVINAYKLSAEEAESVSDKLVQTQNDGKTTVNELASSLGQIIPTASALNVNLDNVLTSYALMTKQGIRTADATTALRSTLSELSDQGSTVAGILRDRTGKSFGELMADGQSLGDVLGVLYDSVDGNGEAFKNLWGNVRAGTGALAIAQSGTEGYTEELGRMQGAAGNVSAALEDLATPSARAANAINAVKNTGIELGQEFLGALSPALEAAVDAAQGLYKWFSELDDGTKQAAASALALAAAAGPVVLGASKVAAGVSGVLSKGALAAATLAKLSATGGVAAAAVTSLGTALSSPALAAAVLTAAVAACAKGIYDTKARMDQMSGATTGLDEAVRTLAPDFETATASTAVFAQGMARAKVDVESVTAAQAELAASIAERNQSAQAEINQLESARAVIEQYMNQTGLTAQQQGELKAAIDYVNEACGTQYTVVDAANGAIADETGAILDNTNAIRGNIAERQALIRTEALEKNLDNLYAQQADDIAAVASATADYRQKLAELQELEAGGVTGERWQAAADAVDAAAASLAEAQGDLDSVNSAISATNEQLGNLEQAASGAELTLGQLASTKVEISSIVPPEQLQAFCDQLDQSGMSVEQFNSLTQQQMMELAMSWDGSTGSIIAAARRMGVEVPEGMDVTSEASSLAKEAASAYERGIADGETPTRSAAAKLASAAAAMKVSGSWQWGYDAASNFAAGLDRGSSLVSSAASAVASTVAAILGHSVPKEGPLHNRGRGETEWGQHAVENFARGMSSSEAVVARAARDAAAAAAWGLQAQAATSGGAAAAELRLSASDVRLLAAEIARAAAARAQGPGNITMNVYPSDGMDAEAFADAVVADIENLLDLGA